MPLDASLIDHIGDGVLAVDANGTCRFANAAAARLVGDAAAVVGDAPAPAAVWAALRRRVGDLLGREARRAVETGAAVEFEARSAAGEQWITLCLLPSPEQLTVVVRDSSVHHVADRAMVTLFRQLDRQRRLTTVLAEANEVVFRARTPEELFAEAVRLGVDHGGFTMAWIGLLEAGSGELLPVSWAGQGAERYLEEIRVSARDDPSGSGIGGLALRSGAPRYTNDIAADAAMGAFQVAAARAGFRSSGAFPLHVEGRPAGLLSVYSPEPGFFSEEEVTLVRRLAANVAYGWEALQREAALKDAEVARRSAQRLRAVLSAAPDALLAVGRDGHIELVNAEAEALFGWDPGELVGQPVEVLVPAALAEGHRGARGRFLGPGGPGSIEGQFPARRRDGSVFPADIKVSTVVDDGRLSVLASVRDLTERLELEEERRRLAVAAERERADRLDSLGMLAGGVAHDFNNLLGVILNYVTLLERQALPASAHADVSEIRVAADRGAALTRQLLAFARADPARAEVVEINDVVRRNASMLGRTLGATIELRVELSEQPLAVSVDPSQLDQVIVNLAINARDAMVGGGRLVISTACAPGDPPGAVLRVVDSGSGMAPEVAGRAFEPFFTTKHRGEGTGLGLAAVYGIVQRAGGRVGIDSRPGAGTAVTVRLPLAAAAASVRARPEGGAAPDGGGARVLLVEDDPQLRDATRRIVQGAGYRVDVAADGVEALEVLARAGNEVDVVLSDVVMPRMGGEELLRRVPQLPAVLMTGHGPDVTGVARRVVHKPVERHQLLRALREALDGR